MAANIEHTFYTPGPWVQPNMRNIGDSLLDLYKMKLAREEATRQSEESKMNMELKRLDMQRKLEEEKRQKEFTKQAGNFVNQYQKSQNLPPAGTAQKTVPPSLGAMVAAGGMPGPLAGVMSNAMQGSFPAPQTPETLQRNLAMASIQSGDPEKIAAALKLLNPAQSGRTAEEQMAIDNNRNKLKQVVMAQALEDRKAAMDYAQTLRDGTIQGEQKFKMYMAQVNQGFQERMVKLQIASRPDAAPFEMEGLLYSRPAGGGYAPVMVPDVPAAAGAVLPSAPPPPPMVAPGAGASMMAIPDVQSPGMQNAANVPLPADYGTGPSGATLYSDQTATGTAPLGPESLPTGEPLPQTPTGMHQARATPKVASARQTGILTQKDVLKTKQGWTNGPVMKGMNQALGDYKKINRLINQINSDAQSGKPIAVNQLGLLWTTIKSLDNSVVRPSEAELFTAADTYAQRLQNAITQFGADSEDVRKLSLAVTNDLARMSRMAYQSTWDAFGTARDEYLTNYAPMFIQSGLIKSPDELVAPLGEGYTPTEEGAPSPATPTQSALPAGAVLQRDKTGKTVGYRVGDQKFYMDGTPVSGGK